ncbi:MAG: ABC transporter permease [Oscillospiraceae bacterium]|nr:ABC transporter permease [Oscillospiraceae bacterium]
MKNTLLDIYEKEGTKKVLSSLISILVGLFVGAIVVVIVGLTKDTITNQGIADGVKLIFAGILCTGRNAAGELTWGFHGQALGNMLFRAMPLIMTGLSVAVANKTGLFNIGAPGQYLMGTMASLMIALGVPSGVMPGWALWLLAFLGGMLAGALWGAIPGILKAFLNINEVLACIMTNWLAANIVTWGFDVSNFKNIVENTKSGYVYKTTFGLTEVDGAWTYVNGNGIATAKLGLDKIFSGSQINAGILVAVLFAIAMYILMNKTTLGYQLKACGSNRHAARYAGINDKRNIVLSMAIAGALSAAGASLYWLSGNTEFFWSTYQSLPAIGFNGIPVALLAVNNPIGVIFSGMFMAMLDIVGQNLTGYTAYNEYITDVIISVIVYLSAFSLVIQTMLPKLRKANAANANAEPDPVKEEETKEGGETV